MYLTQSNQIKRLPQTDYEALREMCRYAKNLYNVGLYSIHQYFLAEGRFLRYASNYQVVKDNETYALLQAGVSQQILKVVDRSFRAFFNLLKKAKKGEYRYHEVRIPHFLDKNDYFPLILSTNAIVANMDKRNNQHFVQIPHGQLRNQLEALCERYGIQYVEQEDSDTSKASFLDGDAIPLWNGTHQTVLFSGKRGQCGLYRTKAHLLLNGATNIFRKSNHRLDFEQVARGLLANPLRVKLTSVGSS